MLKQQLLSEKEIAKQDKRVRKFANKWIGKLQLDLWEINLVMENSYEESDNMGYHPQAVDGVWEAVMSTSADPWYMVATIYCFLPVIVNMTDARLEESIIHEFMHVYLAPLSSNKHKKEEEMVATHLARTFMRI